MADSGGGGLFFNLGRTVATFPSVFVFVGVAVAVALATGLIDPPFESDLNDLWIEEGGRVDIERDYTDDHSIPGTRSTAELWTTISLNNDADASDTANSIGSVLTTNVLLEHLDAAQALAEMTVEIDSRPGITFDIQDICRAGAADYVIQCTRVTALDCFREGNYDLPTRPSDPEVVLQMALNVVNDPGALALVSSTVEDLRATVCPRNDAGEPIYEGAYMPVGVDGTGNPIYAQVPPLTEDGAPDLLKILCGIMDGIVNPADPNYGPYFTDVPGDGQSFNAPDGSGTNDACETIVNGACVEPYTFQFAGPPPSAFSAESPLCTVFAASPDAENLVWTPVDPGDGSLLADPGCQPGYTLVELTALNQDLGTTAVNELINLGYVFQGDANVSPYTGEFDSDNWVNSRGIAYYTRPSLESYVLGGTAGNPLPPVDSETNLPICACPSQGPIPGLDTCGEGTEGFCGTAATETTITEYAASRSCFFWDNGAALPAIPRDIILGQADRSKEEFQALEFVVYAIEAEAVAEKVKSAWRSPVLGGPIQDLTKDEAQEVLDKWRVQFVESVSGTETTYTQHNAFSSDSFDLILEEFSDASLPLIVAGYAILIVYAFFTLKRNSSKCDKVLVLSKSMVGGVGVLMVALGVGGGLGLACYVGIPLNATSTQVLPFLLLGLGVDDMFVIAHNIDEDWDTEVPILIGQLMAVVGPSITLTSFTNAIAFAIGTLTPLPVVIDFASQASISICVLYGINLFVFPALLALNEHRMRSKRIDCLPCVTREEFEREERGGKEGFLKDVVLNKYYIPFLKNIVGKLVVFTIFGIIFALGVYGAVEKVELGLSIADVAPKGTQEYEFLTVRYDYFSFYDMQISTQEFDYETVESQQGMISLFERVSDTDHVVPGGTMWLHGLLAWGFPDHGMDCTADENTGVYSCVPDTYYSQALQDSYYYFLCRLSVVSQVILGIDFGGLTAEEYCRGPATFGQFKATIEATVCGGIIVAGIQQGLLPPTTNPADTALCPAIAGITVNGNTDDTTEYGVVIAGLLGVNSLLDFKNGDCDPSNALTNGQCGPLQTTLNGINGNAGCTSIFQPKVDGIELDVQGVSTNRVAMCVDFSELGGTVECFTSEVDNYYACVNSFAQESSAAGLLSPYWFPDTGILGGGTVDAEGNARVIGDGGLEYSEYSMYSFDLVTNEDYVDLIEQVRDVCEASSIPSYPKGTGFLYWEQYLGLQETLLKNIIFALVAVFFTTLILLLVVPKKDRENLCILLQAAFGGAFTLVFLLSMYMVEIYGFMGWMEIKLSALPAVSLIMAVGVGVEFTAHIILAFILAEGDRNDRMEAALDHMFVPTIDGTISTFLGIIMLAASEFEFIVKYYFLVYLIIVVLGCLNGLVLLPALLAIAGPPSISLPDAGGKQLGYRRGSITSPRAEKNPSVELHQKGGSDFV